MEQNNNWNNFDINTKEISVAHISQIFCCRHYPDNKAKVDFILTTSNDCSIKVWNVNLFTNEAFIRNGKILKDICIALDCETNNFNPSKVEELLHEYKKGNKWKGRIIYSFISNYIFDLYYGDNDEDFGRISTNSRSFLDYVFNKCKNNEYGEDYENILTDAIKIYDHVNLSLTQRGKIEFSSAEARNQINELASEIKTDIKSSEKNYITILGIFASIVIGAVGAYQSVLSASVSATNETTRLLGLKIVGISFVVSNVLFILTQFVIKLNDKDKKDGNNNKYNYIYILVFDIVLILLFILFG